MLLRCPLAVASFARSCRNASPDCRSVSRRLPAPEPAGGNVRWRCTMHEQNGTLVRDGTERMMLMEVCPVCGEQRRNSARFCTTCGHRFATDEIVNAPVPPVTPDATTETGASDDPLISGWPAPAPRQQRRPGLPPQAAPAAGPPLPPQQMNQTTRPMSPGPTWQPQRSVHLARRHRPRSLRRMWLTSSSST